MHVGGGGDAIAWMRSAEPGVVLPIVLGAWLYARGVRRIWRRAGRGRGVRRWQAVSFGAGMATVLLALASPLHEMSEALFAAHMVQHELLMLVAAPLIVLGAPGVPFLWALPERARHRAATLVRARGMRSVWSALVHPATAWVLQAVAILLWHAPPLYQSALEHEPVHALQHACFMGTALLFWESLVRLARRRRSGYGVAVLSLFTTAIYGSMLGALLTFAPSVWYPAYGHAAAAWGLTPLEDQQLGGLIMWIPFGLVYVIAAVAMFGAWMRAMDRREVGVISIAPAASRVASTPLNGVTAE
ncbi:MAG TPA: cytochrome c oxidase assembly protein [Gemmatimonadaceae bacterium]|nr:cytochrome c oxidase assembly protein [Gemmatimonadaceae bacterium]